MSQVKAKKFQIGSNATATNNFSIYQPDTVDGSLRIANGNADTPTDVLKIDSSGTFYVPEEFHLFSESALSNFKFFAKIGQNDNNRIALRASAVSVTGDMESSAIYGVGGDGAGGNQVIPFVVGHYLPAFGFTIDTGGDSLSFKGNEVAESGGTSSYGYIRYYSGAQVAWRAEYQGTTDSNGNFTVPLPVTFSDANYSVSLASYSGAYIFSTYSPSNSTTGVRVVTRDYAGAKYANSLATVGVIVTGRWY